ncbi:hypothetical protein Slin15195_G107990 [Septoria linicola]|uniref:Uncharacterized protein n=1 Tax=Septoria linicola TaxID=215465 RepID=A0A9Q9ENW4_9PEZI|nr:hypothetical protein Slin14017_G106290 [Septoria linicola]USW57480.1 hypothetical protein Slin15195_G107990 [Septoria linicola]
MNDYELQQELEALAGNAYDPDKNNSSSENETKTPVEPISATISRWAKLFHMTSADAVDRIMEHRYNITRTRVSDAHWETVQDDKESQGYDREAYEYELDLQRKQAVLPSLLPTSAESGSTVTYLVEITGPLHSVEKIRGVAKMEKVPEVVKGTSQEDGRAVELCCVDGVGKSAVLEWASREGGGFEPTILVDPRSLQ